MANILAGRRNTLPKIDFTLSEQNTWIKHW
jgi:hypothetical protein